MLSLFSLFCYYPLSHRERWSYPVCWPCSIYFLFSLQAPITVHSLLSTNNNKKNNLPISWSSHVPSFYNFHRLHNHPIDLSLFLLESEVFGLIIFLIKFWFFYFPPPHHPQLFCPLPRHFITSLLLSGLVSVSSPTPTPPFPLMDFYLILGSTPNLTPHIHSPLYGCLVQLQKADKMWH